MKDNDDADGTQQPESNPFVLFRRHVDRKIAAAFHPRPDPATDSRTNDVFQDVQDQEHKFWTRLEQRIERSVKDFTAELERDQAGDRWHSLWYSLERAFDRTMNPMRVQTERDDQDEQTHLSSHPRTLSQAKVKQAQIAAGCPATFPTTVEDERTLARSADEHKPLWTLDGWGRAWTLNFFENSPYSPLRLEKEMDKTKVNWRHAFEDLLLADAVDYEADAFNALRGRDAGLDAMSGRQWTDALLCSGLLHSRSLLQDRLVHSPTGMMQQVVSKLHGIPPTMPKNEMEFYDRLSSIHDHSEPKDNVFDQAARETLAGLGYHKEAQQWPPQEQEQKQGNIVSQVTTTERRTLPDGSTTTKTIFKRRFADGTEESEERHNTTPPTRQTSRMPESRWKDGGDTNPGDNLGKKSSWFSFWSD